MEKKIRKMINGLEKKIIASKGLLAEFSEISNYHHYHKGAIMARQDMIEELKLLISGPKKEDNLGH